MKKSLIGFVVFGLIAGVSVLHAATAKKYDLKSGIITMNSVTKMGKVEMASKLVVYFDDYGMKECKETYEAGTLKESTFSDGKNLYSLYHTRKRAGKNGVASRGTELRVAFEEMGSKKDRDSGKVKKIAPMKIAGKECEAVEVNSGSTVTRYAGWKGVMVYMKLDSGSMTTTITAEKIEENVSVPQDKFVVPAGYTVQ